MRSTKEIWLTIPITELMDFYEVSNLGRVRSLDRVIIYKDGRNRLYTGTVLSQRNGVYYTVLISINKKEYCFAVHRLVALTFVKNPENYPIVNHIDCNKKNNNAYNLEWTNAVGNANHAIRNGRHKGIKRNYGENHHRSVLTKENIISIRELKISGFNRTQIGKKLNLNRSTVGNILNNKCWNHV